MAYREADFSEPCAECEVSASQQCARCMRFFCQPHLITDLCTACEEAFLARSQRSRWWRAPISMMAGAAGTLICVATAVLVGADMAVLALATGLSFFAISTVALESADARAHRRAFVRELHGGRMPKALPAPR